MDIDVFPARDLDMVFSVLRTALRHSGKLTPRERLFLAAYARNAGYSLPKADPIPLIAQEVHIEGAHLRKRLIQLAAVAALFNDPVTPGTAEFLRELSWHLRTRESLIDIVEAVEKGRHIRARVLAAQRGLAITIEQAYLSGGIAGALGLVRSLILGTAGDWKRMTEAGFGSPGASISSEICTPVLETAA